MIAGMPMQMWEDGYRDILCVDQSPIVVKDMKERMKGKEGVEFVAMDVKRLDLESEGFDLVIDKAMLDVIMAGEGSFDHAYESLKSIYRVLKCGGSYVVVSNSSPKARIDLFRRRGLTWDVVHQSIPKDPSISGINAKDEDLYHIYTLKKPARDIFDDDDE
jgi:ubiquinone/menaquinone biosynthesis C-methylase UbiE